MENKLNKKYGLLMAICMVIGIVIGSGVFFKAQEILIHTGGNVWLGVLSFIIGGIVMIVCALTFAKFASKYEKDNGIVDYSEFIVGKKYAYLVGWFTSIIYFPAMTSILAWVSSRYTLVLFGVNDASGGLCMILAGVYLIAMYALNSLSPKLAGKFHVSTTIIKLIPLLVMIVVGSIYGLVNDNISSSFTHVVSNNVGFDSVFSGIVASAFAYEGWIIATTINAELKDSKRNLPKALVGGTIAVLVIYLIYYISLSSILGNQGTVVAGDNAPIQALSKILGSAGGVVFTVFIMISCLGTVNGLIISSCRGMYTLSCRGHGPAPEKFSKLGKNQSVSLYSTIYGYAFILIMLAVWCLAIKGVWIFRYLGGMDSTVCALIYGVYITMYVHMMVKFKDLDVFRRFVMPIIAILGSLFFIICGSGIYQIIFAKDISTFISFLVFMGLFVIFMFPCLFFYRKENENQLKEESDVE